MGGIETARRSICQDTFFYISNLLRTQSQIFDYLQGGWKRSIYSERPTTTQPFPVHTPRIKTQQPISWEEKKRKKEIYDPLSNKADAPR